LDRRFIGLAAQFRTLRCAFLQNVVNGSQRHSSNSNKRFLVIAAFLDRIEPVGKSQILLAANGGNGALHKQWLDIGSRMGEAGCFLLPGSGCHFEAQSLFKNKDPLTF